MVSFFQKKRPDAFVSDTYCRNILLSLHCLRLDIFHRVRISQSWRVITKKYLVIFCQKHLFFDDDHLFFRLNLAD